MKSGEGREEIRTGTPSLPDGSSWLSVLDDFC
jgi:hypothetical protein